MNRIAVLASSLLACCAVSDTPAIDVAKTAPETARSDAATTCDPKLAPFGGGTGSAADPYLLCSLAHWEAIGAPRDLSYRLAADLDFATGRARVVQRFYGHLEGAGHTLSNVRADGTQKALALIHENHGVIENLNVVSAEMKAAAVLVYENRGILDRLTVSGKVTGTVLDHTGGIAAQNIGLIMRSRFTGDVSGSSAVGGIAGYNYGVIHDVDVDGNMRGGSMGVGGVAGLCDNCIISFARGKGSAMMGGGLGRGAGGIVGMADGPGAHLSDLRYSGATYSNQSAGGIAGRINHSAVLERCVANADVIAEETPGAIVGLVFNGTARDCYATGTMDQTHSSTYQTPEEVLGNGITGGFFLGKYIQGTAHDPFAVIAQKVVTPSQIADPQSYAGFDATIWNLDAATFAADGHPRLRFESQAAPVYNWSHARIEIEAFSQSASIPKIAYVRHLATGAVSRVPMVPTDATGQFARALVRIAPGKVEITFGDDWNDACKMRDGSWDPDVTKKQIDAPADVTTHFDPFVHCSNVGSLLLPAPPFLTAAAATIDTSGTEISNAAGVVYRLSASQRLTKDGVDVTPAALQLDHSRPMVIKGKICFFTDDPSIVSGWFNPSSYLQHPVAQRGFVRYETTTGKWMRDKYNSVNLAKSKNIAIEEERIISGDFDGRYERYWLDQQLYYGEEIYP